VNNLQFIAAYRARLSNMKTKRLKPTPIATRDEFHENISALLTLEALTRKINAERDARLIEVNREFDARIAPYLADIKGRMALVSDYAEKNRSELLPKKEVKSFTAGLARVGWRTGNRTVAQRYGVTAEQAINALEALHLEAYVRTKKEIARDLILADCTDDATLSRPKRDAHGQIILENSQPILESVALADVGLKIAQTENLFVEPISENADTLKVAPAA